MAKAKKHKPKPRPARKHTRKVARKTKRPAAKPIKKSPSAEHSGKRAVVLLKWTHKTTTDLAGDFPADKATHQPTQTDNHLVWSLGHLATSYVWFTGLLGGTPHALPSNYDALFGFKSKPTSDPAAYPPLDEVRQHHDAAFAIFLAAAEAVTAGEASLPPAGDSFGFATDRADVIHKAAWHEGWHAGQISSLRRALGLKPLMG